MSDLAEKCIDLTTDLKLAIREGWLQAEDRYSSCNYCHAEASYVSGKGAVAQHEPSCLVTKHADLVGDLNDPCA
jgi:hypothetical protein